MHSKKFNSFAKKTTKIAPTTLPTIAGNASTAFPASLLSASANLSNHFFRISLSFGGEPPVPPPKAPVMTSAIVEIVIEKTVSIGNIVMPCSRNNVRIRFANELFIKNFFNGLLDPCNLCLKIFSIL